jgi:hypothetical protein
MWTLAAAVLNATLTAINAGVYASEGSSLNLGVAIFCGLMFFYMLAVDPTRS